LPVSKTTEVQMNNKQTEELENRSKDKIKREQHASI
jgi:hypothetical protein